MPSEVSTTTEAVTDTRLVVLDDEGDVVVMDRDGSNKLPVAEVGDVEQAFGQPIWSPDGESVSYARADDGGFAYVVHDLAAGTITETNLEQFPFYASWSPSLDHVAVLRNGATGVTLEMIETANGTLTRIGTATPYYFAWSPDGADLVGHVGPERLVRQAPTGVVDDESQTSANYLAPNWVEQGIIEVQADEIVITSVDGVVSPVASVTGPAFFVVNPQGSRIATQVISIDPAVTVALEDVPTMAPNTVSIVDFDVGEVSVALDDPAIGFFWSPDGERLLILAPDEGTGMLTTHVWEGGETRQYASFVPHPSQVRDVFPFFPQYALSMSYWSTDSSAFAVVGAIEDVVGVWVQDVATSTPVRVSDGSWVSWSP